MKNTVTCVIAICLVLASCRLQREMEKDMEVVSNNLPNKISTEDEANLKASYIRGYHLYKQTCSDCHGTSLRGKDTIPAFTFFQLDNYKDAAKKGDPENHAVMKKLSPEQVSDVMSFLLYKTLSKKRKQEPDAGN